MTRQTRLATQTQAVAETVADLQCELEGLIVNAAACGLKSRIELLVDLRARYITAEKDLPDRRDENDSGDHQGKQWIEERSARYENSRRHLQS